MIHNVKTSSLQEFKASIKDIPVLSKEQEESLFSEYKDTGSKVAKDKLIIHNMRFVSYIVAMHKGYSVSEEDLIQEGLIGLIKSIDGYELGHGTRFHSYSVFYIKNHIYDFIMNNSRIFKTATTKSQRKLFFNLRSMSNMSDDKIAESLDVPLIEVKNMRQKFLNDVPFMVDNDSDEDEVPNSPHLFLSSNIKSPESMVIDSIEFDIINNLVCNLPERQADIIKERYLMGEPTPFKDLSDKYNISGQRVQQIEKQAIRKMKSDYFSINK